VPELSSSAAAWKRDGAFETVAGHRIFVREREGGGDRPPVPHAELTRLHGLGHYPQIEDPETTYALIERHAAEEIDS
jgi:hypothetical protein